MPERFQQVYTDAQREALAVAYVDRRIRPARLVVELAQAGTLVEGLPAFTVHGGVNTVRDLARKLKQRRAAEHASELAKQPPRDAVEALRRRLVDVTDGMVQAIERQRPEQRDPERVRQAARAVRELAAIPGPTDPPPAKPGHTRAPDGKQHEGRTRGGQVGALLAATREEGRTDAPHTHRGTAPAPSPTDTAPGHGNTTTDGAATDDQAGQHHHQDTAEPGGWARAELARLAAGPEEGHG